MYSYQMEVEADEEYRMDMADMMADDYADWIEAMEADFASDHQGKEA